MTTLSVPRVQVGANPQWLIMTLFGDYWLGRQEHLPSSALVAIATEFGLSEASIRVALSRLSRRGMLISSKVGRRTFYGINPEARELLRVNRDRAVAFLSGPHEAWDGTWTVVAFSVPEHKREERHALRARLRRLGFGALYDGVWVSPRPLPTASTQELSEVAGAQVTVLSAKVESLSATAAGHPMAAWDLDEVRQAYQDFLVRFEPLVSRVHAGQIGASEALASRTEVMDTWRQFPRLDPDLPAQLLPADWPRSRAKDVFVEVYEALGPLAELRFRQILRAHSPELAELVRYHATDAREPRAE